MKTLIVVLGPTGVGKTELCLSLAEHLAIPIINAGGKELWFFPPGILVEK